MALIVEDGSIVTGANSYTTVAEQRAYASARGITLSNNDSDVEVLSTKAMDYLEAQRANYQGSKVEPSVQELQWPRKDVQIDCSDFPSDEIPKELKNAQMQLVIESHNGVDFLSTQTEAFITEETTGPLTTKYSDKFGEFSNPTMSAVDALLEPLFNACGGGAPLKSLRV